MVNMITTFVIALIVKVIVIADDVLFRSGTLVIVSVA